MTQQIPQYSLQSQSKQNKVLKFTQDASSSMLKRRMHGLGKAETRQRVLLQPGPIFLAQLYSLKCSGSQKLKLQSRCEGMQTTRGALKMSHCITLKGEDIWEHVELHTYLKQAIIYIQHLNYGIFSLKAFGSAAHDVGNYLLGYKRTRGSAATAALLQRSTGGGWFWPRLARRNWLGTFQSAHPDHSPSTSLRLSSRSR